MLNSYSPCAQDIRNNISLASQTWRNNILWSVCSLLVSQKWEALLHLIDLLSLIWHPLVRVCVCMCVQADLLSPAVLIQRVRAKPELTSVCQPLGSGEEECEWWLMASLQKQLSGAQKRPERQIAACTHRCLSLVCTDRQACRGKALSLLLATLPSYAYTSRTHTHTHMPHAEAKSCQQSVEWTNTTVVNPFCCI